MFLIIFKYLWSVKLSDGAEVEVPELLAGSALLSRHPDAPSGVTTPSVGSSSCGVLTLQRC